jgi:hypothetical protein
MKCEVCHIEDQSNQTNLAKHQLQLTISLNKTINKIQTNMVASQVILSVNKKETKKDLLIYNLYHNTYQ